MATPDRLRAARRIAEAALNTVLPPQCLSCRVPVDRQGHLCAACWSEIDFITDPLCAMCGTPFEYDAGDGALCAACIAEPPVCARVRAALRYDDPIPAPIAKGTPIARLLITMPQTPSLEVPLVAGSNVGGLGVIGRLGAAMNYLLWGGEAEQ